MLNNVAVEMQVIWLDVVAARARYGRWIGGTLPTFVPVPVAGKASATARKGNKPPEGQNTASDGEEEEKFSIRLKQLRYRSLQFQDCLMYSL